MNEAPRVELPYLKDTPQLFARVAHLPWPVFLDSGGSDCASARYDIIAARPVATLVTRGGLTTIDGSRGARRSAGDPLGLLRSALGERRAVPGDLPFAGGAIGYFSYDLARRFERLPAVAADDLGLPEMAVGIYDWAVVVDHRERRCWLAGHADGTVRALLAAPARRAPGGVRMRSPLVANLDRDEYASAFRRVKHYIREGDCYQVNLARRFSVRAEGDPWGLYCQLRALNPAPFGAFLSTPHGAVLSVSPERFLKVSGGAVETRPIKGTRPRGATPAEDRRLAAELQASLKDRAENLMIVDLLRNDLSKACDFGTVDVPALFALETCPTVHHLVSTVTGRLAGGRDALDLLRGCFPGGSITGAPKLRAMEIIEELEPHRRSVYCGAIGYLGYDGGMDTNIAIRTMLFRHHSLHFWAGGGIVADSQLESEYQEILHKGQSFWTLLQQLETASVGG